MTLHNRVWDQGDTSNGVLPANDIGIWSLGDPIPQSGERLLIGIARWSRYDHRLLSLLETIPRNTCQIELFDADRCKSQEAVRDYIADIGFAHHTPFVGLWRDGVLVESENGYAGRHLIYRVLGLDAAQADEFVIHARTTVTV